MKMKIAFAFLTLFAVSFAGTYPAAARQDTSKSAKAPTAKITRAVAFDISPAMRTLPLAPARTSTLWSPEREVRPEPGPEVKNRGISRDGALQETNRSARLSGNSPTIPSPLVTFEGLKNTDNAFLVAPPDPVGAVGPNHYVEMVNLVFAVYDKLGNKLAGPTNLGELWRGFAVPDCNDFSGDPIVLYDRHEDRWILSQFTTAGLFDPTLPFYNCVAISQTGDPTGAYFRYAFNTTFNNLFFFPDYPKYGVWTNSYLLTSRDFGPTGQYGISVYALEKQQMIAGDPNARMVHFFLDSAVVPISQLGDGLLPADLDGDEEPKSKSPAPIVGTMDDDGPYGAPFDALNIYELAVRWKNKTVNASLNLVTQLPVAPFDSTFPCVGIAPASRTRSCIPQPGTTRKIDILSYRQRPTWRLAYRKFDGYEALVTNQSVQARPGEAGVRWYEIRRTQGQYSLFQQGTYAPNDGVHRWMGSIAMDGQGNIGLGYSVSNATNVFPGIRFTARMSGDPLGEMTLGEAVLIDGTGSQLTRSSRWGDYTSLNVDPSDDCTLWYVNEYYQTTSLAGWQTRIGSFQLPGCTNGNQRTKLK